MHHSEMGLIRVELQQLCRSGLTVHKDLVRQSAPGLLGAGLCGIFPNDVISDKAIFPLLITGVGWVTLRWLLRRGEIESWTLSLFNP